MTTNSKKADKYELPPLPQIMKDTKVEETYQRYTPNPKHQTIRAAFNKFHPQTWIHFPDILLDDISTIIVEKSEENETFRKDMLSIINEYKKSNTINENGKIISKKKTHKQKEKLSLINFFKKHTKFLGYDLIETLQTHNHKDLPEELYKKIKDNSFYNLNLYEDNNILDNAPIQLKDPILAFIIKIYGYKDAALGDIVDTIDYIFGAGPEDEIIFKWMLEESMDESLANTIKYLPEQIPFYTNENILKDIVNKRMDKSFLAILIYTDLETKLIKNKEIITQMINFGMYQSLSRIAETNNSISNKDLKICKNNVPKKIIFFKMNKHHFLYDVLHDIHI